MVQIHPGPRLRAKPRSRELIPALLAELERLDSNALAVGTRRAADFRARIRSQGEWFESDEAEELLEELLCALTDCAGSSAVYFGRRTPESDEFGFWECDD
jgi:hypothetical protein